MNLIKKDQKVLNPTHVSTPSDVIKSSQIREPVYLPFMASSTYITHAQGFEPVHVRSMIREMGEDDPLACLEDIQTNISQINIEGRSTTPTTPITYMRPVIQ